MSVEQRISPCNAVGRSAVILLDGIHRLEALSQFLKFSTLVGKYFSFNFFFFLQKIKYFNCSGHRNSSGFSLMIIFNLYNSCFGQRSDNAIIAFKGDHPVNRLAIPQSCRCIQETEDNGENCSY